VVGVKNNVPNAQGGLGQYVIGTFTAVGTTESVSFTGVSLHPQINAFQVRQLAVPVIPVPPAVWTGLSTLVVLGGMGLLRRRAPK
jgi:hypothetical protein